MKKILKIGFISLVLAVLCVVGITTYQYKTYAPNAVTQEAVSSNLVYFQSSYEECRSLQVVHERRVKKSAAMRRDELLEGPFGVCVEAAVDDRSGPYDLGGDVIVHE